MLPKIESHIRRRLSCDVVRILFPDIGEKYAELTTRLCSRLQRDDPASKRRRSHIRA